MKVISCIKNWLRSLYSTDDNTVKIETEETIETTDVEQLSEETENNTQVEQKHSDEGIHVEQNKNVCEEEKKFEKAEKKNINPRNTNNKNKKQKKNVLKIKNGTEIIEKGKYKNNKDLEKVFIPSSVTKIERSAFFGCDNLKRIIFANNTQNIPEIEQEVFCYKVDKKLVNLEKLEAIEVPERLVEQMKKMKGWNRYSKLIKELEIEK